MDLSPQRLKPQPATGAAPLGGVAERGRVLLWVAGAIGLGLCAFVLIEPDDGTRPIEYLAIGYFIGTLFGQAALAGVWTALGPLALCWRLPLALGWLFGLLVAVALKMGIHRHGGGDDILFVLGLCVLGLWILVQLPLWWPPLGMGLN
jgi:hypothetical protein